MGQSLRRVLLLAEDDDGEDGEDAVARSSGRLLRASGSLTSIDEWGMIEDDDEDDPDEYNCQSDDDSDSASLVTFAAASHADGGNSGAFTFPDLNSLPTELALEVLSHLNATDLCLAACVWQKLATDEILWQGLCRQQWPEASIYGERRQRLSYRRVYLLLDEGTLTFNSDPHEGMRYFFDNGLVRDEAGEIARFFHGTKTLNRTNVRSYLQARSDVVDRLFKLQDYGKLFLPNALRKCFAKLEAPEDRGRYLHDLLDSFSKRFCQCNPDLGYSPDSVYVMCFSLIILSVDLTSPHVKNKMSKREFIRNTRNAVWTRPVNNNNGGGVARGRRRGSDDDDLFGRMYDNVFLRGHVSTADADAEGATRIKSGHHRYVPGYLAMFL